MIKNKEYKKFVLEQLELIKAELDKKYNALIISGLGQTKELNEVIDKLTAMRTTILEIRNL